MRRYEFVDTVSQLVEEYIKYGSDADPDMMLRVNPVNDDVILCNNADMQQEIAFADEAIEQAAGVEGDESESATDFQARENADFYPVKMFITKDQAGKEIVDDKAIERIADNYSFSR